MAEDLLILYEKEKLWAAWGTGHLYAALAWNAVAVDDEGSDMEGNDEGRKAMNKAVWHARRSVEMGTLASGAVENNRVEMKALADDPRGHWSWGLRRRG